MTKHRLFLLATMMLLAANFAVDAQTANPAKPEFVPGQMWSIKSATPTTAKVIVGRVEDWNGKTAVHVSVMDVPIPAGAPGAGGTIGIGHMPFDESALAESVDKLLETGVSPGPNFEAGYNQWQSAKGGIYTVSVSAAVATVFQALGQRNLAPR
jgi:hypothetical protein